MKWLLLFSITLLCTFAKAKEVTEVKETSESRQLIDTTHQKLGNSILYLTNSIDNFFGEKKADDYNNGSSLRLFYTVSKEEYSDLESSPQFRIRLVFPQLQDRLKFKYSNKIDEQATNNQNKKLNASDKEKSTKETIVKKPIKFKNAFKWNVHFESGVRVDFPPNPFTKLRIDKNIKLANWIIVPNQEFFWFLRDGFGETTSLNFDNQVNNKILFRYQNEVTWLDETDEVNFVFGPTLYHRLSSHRAIAYNIKASGINKPTVFVNNYKVSIDYRQKLYKEWFFYELNPAVNFPKDKDFKKVYSIAIKFETVFGSF